MLNLVQYPVILLSPMTAKISYVYILASGRNGTLYIGVTSNLTKRLDEHKSHAIKGFTEKYNVTQLIWHEHHAKIRDAIAREKQIKNWRREWKIKLIEDINPEWKDLAEELF